MIVILRLLAIKAKMINKLLLPERIKTDHYQMELLLIIELNRKPITILNSNNQMDRVIHHKEDQMVKCKVDRVINNKEEAVIKGIRCKEDLVDKEIK